MLTRLASEDNQPVFFHGPPAILADELIHDHGLISCIELCGIDGNWALACVSARKPYLGICFTIAHMEAVSARLEDMIFQCMKKEGHPLYQPALNEVMSSITSTKTTGEDGEGGALETPKGKTTGRKRTRTGAAASSNSTGKEGKDGGSKDDARKQLIESLKAAANGKPPKKKGKTSKDDDMQEEDGEADEEEEADSGDETGK